MHGPIASQVSILARAGGRSVGSVERHHGTAGRHAGAVVTSQGIKIQNPCKNTDLACFVNEVEQLLEPDTTVVISWEHTLFPQLLRTLGVTTKMRVPHEGRNRGTRAYDDAPLWQEHWLSEPKNKHLRHNGGSAPVRGACFDIVWQLKFFASGEEVTKWDAVEARAIHNGFEGAADGPYAEGLA
jgi:hypothetical protein